MLDGPDDRDGARADQLRMQRLWLMKRSLQAMLEHFGRAAYTFSRWRRKWPPHSQSIGSSRYGQPMSYHHGLWRHGQGRKKGSAPQDVKMVDVGFHAHGLYWILASQKIVQLWKSYDACAPKMVCPQPKRNNRPADRPHTTHYSSIERSIHRNGATRLKPKNGNPIVQGACSYLDQWSATWHETRRQQCS